MAESNIIRTNLRLIFEAGNDPETGDTIYETKSFNNVYTESTPEALFETAEALGSLQTHTLFGVERYDYSDITTEAE